MSAPTASPPHPVTAPPPAAPAGADTFSLLCPTCGFHFRAAPSPYAPSTFDGCGHSLCGLCADAVALAPAPHCPVCQADIKVRCVNVALGELGEAVWAAAQPAPAAPVPDCVACLADAADTEEGDEAPLVRPGHLKCSKCPKQLCAKHAELHTEARPAHEMEAGEGGFVPAAARAPARCLAHADIPPTHFCVTDNTVICALCVLKDHAGHECVLLESGCCEARLRESAARLTPAAEAMMRGVAVALQTIAALGSAKDSAVKQIEAEMDTLFVRLFAYGADMVKRVEVVYDERVKALEAQAEELAVTSAQLRAAAEVATHKLALPQSSSLGIARAYECVHAVGRLVGDCPAPAATAILRVECEPAPLLTAFHSLLTLVVDNSRELAAQLARQEADRIRMEEEQKAFAEARRLEAENQAAAEEARVQEAALAHSASLAGSAILASVAPERLAAFLRELSGWLPGRAYTLLYRGSRDDMTAAAFHRLCDGKGPTLVLVQCDKGWVFGGYAGESWESSLSDSEIVGSGDAFLCSVTGPYTDAPVRFPVKAHKATDALVCSVVRGPCFNGGLYVRAKSDACNAVYDERSRCMIGDCQHYEDTIRRGTASLTGAEYFTPCEVEVYSATRT